jgi:S1-C subfamily serine protease
MTLGMVPTTTATPDLTTLARDAVVRVRNVVCLATATAFFTIDGQVITNRHVIAASVKVQLSYWDGADSDGAVSAISTANDFARLAPTTNRPSKLTLATSDPPAGERIWVAGYPQGDQLQLTAGMVIDVVDGGKFGQSGRVIRSTAPIQPGD